MPQPPDNPKIYHIVHVDRLASIVADECLLSDRVIGGRQGGGTVIGMNGIKHRRLALPVSCHPGHNVGDFVPFYFCPRSVMLYVIHRANDPELTYRGGQGPIIHLEADLHRAIAWAEKNKRLWALSLSNAGADRAQFRSCTDHLDQVNWSAVAATDFRADEVKEGKQAEFLLHGSFPWELVERVGVVSQPTAHQVATEMRKTAHKPQVEVQPSWYFEDDGGR
jgi:hypothetical protein